MNSAQVQQGGFSLLEVAIAMSTLAVLSFGVMFGFTLSGSQDREAYEIQRAQAQAQELIEQAESFSYEDLLAMVGNPVPFNQGDFTCTITVTQIQGDLLAIVANVKNTQNGAYEVSLTTLKTMKQENL